MAASDGDTVKVHYTGKLDDGSVFDSSEGAEPLSFTLGSQQVIPGFEDAVRGLEEGEEKEVTLPPEQAYGEPREELVQQVPKDQLPEGAEEGMSVAVGLPNGQQIPAQITKVEDETVTLDLNHPLAGKTLHFAVKLVGIEKGADGSADEE